MMSSSNPSASPPAADVLALASPLPLTRRAAWFIAVAATLAMSVSYIDRQVLAALAPTVREALALSHAQYGWLTSAFSLAYLVMAPISGAIIDRIGSRRGLLLAVVVWSLVAGAHAFAGTFLALFALRVALGAAESPSFPAAAQAVKRALPPSDRSAGFGLLFTGSSIGAMIAPPLAIALTTRLGSFRLAFVGAAVVGLVWIPVWLLATRGPGAKALLAPAPSRDRPHYRALLSDPAMHRAVLLVAASAPGIMFVLLWLPQYLAAEFHLSQAELAHYVWAPPIAFDVGAVAFGAWASRRERAGEGWPKRGLVLLAALASTSLSALPFASTPAEAIGVSAVTMMGGGGLYALLTAEMLTRVNPASVSSAGGLTAAAQSLVHVVVSPLIGLVVDRTHSYSGVLFTLGLIVLPATVAWNFIPLETRHRSLEP